MNEIRWKDIISEASAAVAALAPMLPAPAGAVALVAAAMAQALAAAGCAVVDCENVADGPKPADIPTGEAGLDALSRLRARSHGLDARGLRDRGMPSQDADELTRSARAEKLAEGVVVIRRRPA
jgi:hypothetical protein